MIETMERGRFALSSSMGLARLYQFFRAGGTPVLHRFLILLFAGLLEAQPMFSITSPAFKDSESIPTEFTCEGDNQSPPLQWSGAPAETKAFVLIVEDPDAPAGTWYHWILFDIPAEIFGFPAGESAGTGGRNSWGKLGYGGPCPPKGTHRYFFKLYALSDFLKVKEGVSQASLMKAMQGKVLAEAQVMGTYRKRGGLEAVP